jgi:MFS family permease
VHAPRTRSGLLGLAVALALADSSVVTLALPDIVSRFHVAISEVAWVLISYNLVLAALAVPAARLVRPRPRLFCTIGLVVFAAASLGCGLAPSFPALLAARCVQAVGAALVVATSLALLGGVEGSERRAAHVWARAGVLGAALGPALGGILTQVAGWEAIFLVQAPVALLPLAALWRLDTRPSEQAGAPAGRPHVGANLALLLGSAALSAALFLLVILLVNGWSIDPAAAGLIVTLMPLAAVAAGKLAPAGTSRVVRAVTGFVLIAGGLAALGLLPRAGWAWTVAPQLLIGAGLGLTVAALTEQALAGRTHQAVHGGWTIASRHAGIVAGLLILTPVFTHELARNQDEATRAGAAIVLDSSIAPLKKISVAREVLRAVDEADGRLPDVRRAFTGDPGDSGAGELQRVGDALQQQLERAVTSAFGPPFLIAALFALAALGVVAVTKDVEP